MVSLSKALRLLRIGKIVKFLQHFELLANAWKVSRVVLGLVLVAHWLTCGLIFLENELLKGDQANSTFFMQQQPPWVEYQGADLYALVLQLAVGMLVGSDQPAKLPAEAWFKAIALLIGGMINAIIMGNVTVLISDINEQSSSFRQKIDGVNRRMKQWRLPLYIQQRTRK